MRGTARPARQVMSEFEACAAHVEETSVRHAAVIKEMEGVTGELLSLKQERQDLYDTLDDCRYVSGSQHSSCRSSLAYVDGLLVRTTGKRLRLRDLPCGRFQPTLLRTPTHKLWAI